MDTERPPAWVLSTVNELEERGFTEPVVIKGGVSPSGVPHLGHVNEPLRGKFIAEECRRREYDVEQILTSDDRDPLRNIPHTLVNLEWERHDIGDVPRPGVVGRNLGKPLTDIPDPFECCSSYGAHQTKLLEDMADRLHVEADVKSMTSSYEDGVFTEITQHLLENTERARSILTEYQSSVGDEYIPFNALCGSCGRLTENITEVYPAERAVEYICDDCDISGIATLDEGKLPWRFEWPAQWGVFDVDVEPFGKDHAEGSWPSGERIANELLGIIPPTPLVYEWITLDGEPLSSSEGNIITVPEVLDILELDVLEYFFGKSPRRARDFSIENIDQLVNEFDQWIDEPRIPYTFAAVLGMTDNTRLQERMTRSQHHIPEDVIHQSTVDELLSRVEYARTWAAQTDNQYNYRLVEDPPEVTYTNTIQDALENIAGVVEGGVTGEEIQEAIFRTAERYDLEAKLLFKVGYTLFFDQEDGPRLGPFLAELDEEFVTERLRRED